MGRRSTKNRSVVVGVASTEVLPADDSRQEIIFSPPAADRYSVAFGEDATLDGGLTVVSGCSHVRLTRDQIGDAITLAVRGIASVQLTASILEVSGG